jgi:hypothetical protein
MCRKLAIAAFAAGFLCSVSGAQFSSRIAPATSATLTMDDLLNAAKHYFRDTAELPMVQMTTFSVIDSSARRRKRKTMETRYLFQGYNGHRNSTQVNVRGHESTWAILRGSRLLWISVNSAVWTTVPGATLYAKPDTYKFEATANSEGVTTATVTPVRTCSSFSMNERNSRWYFPDDLCGPSEFEVSKDLVFQKFSYDASGLPAPVKLDPFGRCTLRRYHADVSFQSVNLPGDKEPFLVPKEVIATLETDKGTIVISSHYEPKPAQAK